MMFLSKRNVSCCSAENGQDAVSIVLSDPVGINRFDIIFMDRHMPVMVNICIYIFNFCLVKHK
jgi:CheY-like chemotaxis protein